LAKTPRGWTGARTPSAIKRVRQAERRRAINQPRKSAAKTYAANAVRVATGTAEGDAATALAEAMRSVESLTIDAKDRATLLVGVLNVALDEVRTKGARPDIVIAGVPAAEPSLRQGLESGYRELAEYADDREDRVRLVDQANSVRSWTIQ